MTETLLDLAARVEAASVPDRELDRAIELAVFPDRLSPPVELELLAYTSSLDAAMTLVPEGWVWSINTFAGGKASACLMNERDEIVRPAEQYIASPALALTAACLRARAPVLPLSSAGRVAQ